MKIWVLPLAALALLGLLFSIQNFETRRLQTHYKGELIEEYVRSQEGWRPQVGVLLERKVLMGRYVSKWASGRYSGDRAEPGAIAYKYAFLQDGQWRGAEIVLGSAQSGASVDRYIDSLPRIPGQLQALEEAFRQPDQSFDEKSRNSLAIASREASETCNLTISLWPDRLNSDELAEILRSQQMCEGLVPVLVWFSPDGSEHSILRFDLHREPSAEVRELRKKAPQILAAQLPKI